MNLGLLVAEKNVDRQTHTQDSWFISIDMTLMPKKMWKIANCSWFLMICGPLEPRYDPISYVRLSMNSIHLYLSVCLSVHVFLSHQKSQLHEILAQGVIWAWFEHDEARFLNFSFLRILWAFFVFFKMRFLVFFSKISAILTPRTMKFGHKDYFYTKKWHKKKFPKNFIF